MLAAHIEAHGGRRSLGETDANYPFLVHWVSTSLSAPHSGEELSQIALKVSGGGCQRELKS